MPEDHGMNREPQWDKVAFRGTVFWRVFLPRSSLARLLTRLSWSVRLERCFWRSFPFLTRLSLAQFPGAFLSRVTAWLEICMRNIAISGAVLAVAFAFSPAAQRAGVFPSAAAAELTVARHHRPAREIHYKSEWPSREYWRWDHRPTWDDPWVVLRPTIWGSPEPYLVPANIWARKWHLPRRHRWHRRHW